MAADQPSAASLTTTQHVLRGHENKDVDGEVKEVIDSESFFSNQGLTLHRKNQSASQDQISTVTPPKPAPCTDIQIHVPGT